VVKGLDIAGRGAIACRTLEQDYYALLKAIFILLNSKTIGRFIFG